MKNGHFHAIGLMSGSSLDGLDIAHCELDFRGDELVWQLLEAETLPFDEKWCARLRELPFQNALAFAKTHTYFGHNMGQLVNSFLEKHQLKPDFIASHGHTVFHHPERRFTTQIGCGGALAATTRTTVVCDFRTQDIAINGEGTPLAPIADKLLFKGYDFYLNLGGIANVSANLPSGFVAFDVTFCNQVLNALAAKVGLQFDDKGSLARSGRLIEELPSTISDIDYFSKKYPKSLDNQWIRTQIVPIFLKYDAPAEDLLHTACHIIARHIAAALEMVAQKESLTKDGYTLLATGGGARNAFLVEILQQYLPKTNVTVPSGKIVDFKEAALMALMGALRLLERQNCLSKVTGALRDTVGGAVYHGN
jgi:anhydro-N-acetylmuramic acid kinase